jgi:glycine betaine/proline transport system substrate-binding protein
MKRFVPIVALTAGLLVTPVQAAEDASCSTVRFADVGWTDNTSTTALTSQLLKGLGYKPAVSIMSLPIAYTGLKTKKIDVFLGYWSPNQNQIIGPFVNEKSLTVLEPPNMTGAKYTLAVPDYTYEAGLKSYADIAKFKDDLNGKIYGIEPGNNGNLHIQTIIQKNQFELKDFKLIESSEAGMLVEVDRAVKKKAHVVFLAWEPHPMNIRHKIKYIEGGDEYFGKNLGEATVSTVVANDYITKCPNVGKLITNLKFTTDIVNQLMVPIIDKSPAEKAMKDWLKANPAEMAKWLDGVQTVDGKPGAEAVQAYLAQ